MVALATGRGERGVAARVLGPPVAGQLHPVVDPQHVVERRRNSGSGQTGCHTFDFGTQFGWDLGGVEFDGLADEKVVGHTDVLIGHLPVDPDRLGIFVGDEVAVLESAFEWCAADQDVHPPVDVAPRSFGKPTPLLVCQLGGHGAGGCAAGSDRRLHIVWRGFGRSCERLSCHDHSSWWVSNRPNFSRFTTSATANQPRTLLPAAFNLGEKAATASRPGATANTPPPTPLLAG